MKRGALIAILTLAILYFSPSAQAQTSASPAGEVWTAIIPDAFGGSIYTWTLQPDGTYLEDGRDAQYGTAIQNTLTGRWERTGPRMVLTQDSFGFVFDGAVSGELYAGTLMQSGRPVSRFCAARGRKAPKSCSVEVGV